MDYGKLDAALAGEIENVAPEAKLNVFIHTAAPVTDAQAAELAALGVAAAPHPSKIFPGVVPTDALGKLSELPWVSRIALARKLRPLEGT
jgi:hypothetical protein